jgi:hypothetical protein
MLSVVKKYLLNDKDTMKVQQFITQIIDDLQSAKVKLNARGIICDIRDIKIETYLTNSYGDYYEIAHKLSTGPLHKVEINIPQINIDPRQRDTYFKWLGEKIEIEIEHEKIKDKKLQEELSKSDHL